MPSSNIRMVINSQKAPNASICYTPENHHFYPFMVHIGLITV